MAIDYGSLLGGKGQILTGVHYRLQKIGVEIFSDSWKSGLEIILTRQPKPDYEKSENHLLLFSFQG